MALQAAYKQFLAAPNTSALADNASLHYITSTTSFRGANEIIKHLSSVRNQIKKKKEDLLHVVEGQNAIAAEVDTAFEFLTSGGPYLPGLDDNFLADRTVYLPVVHMVSFSGDKITTIRQSWDQGSLLKQLDIIGKTGRNWPIRDSTEQLRLIKNSQNSAGVETARPAEPAAGRARKDSSNILRDPHASLALFAPREEAEAAPSVVSPYAGSRPRQRSFTEILGDEPVDEPGTPSRERSMSPSKAIAPKIGAGKNFQPSRLFQGEEDMAANNIPERKAYYKPNEKKYQHFDFSDGSDIPQEPTKPKGAPSQPKSKHDSNWSFDDFSTPAKALPTRGLHRTQDERHWANDDETVTETPVKKPAAPKPRRDAEAHFEFQDDGEPGDEPRLIGRPRGTGHNTGLGLYEQNLYAEDDSNPTPGPARALGNITNLEDRRKDFAPHFEMKDYSPAPHGQTQEQTKVSEDRKKAVKMMESNWSAFEDGSSGSQKENSAPQAARNGQAKNNRNVDDRGITIAGDGMGGRKGGQHWSIGDNDDQQTRSEEVPGKKQGAAQPTSGFWDF
ncbi:hypothetical protein GE09DRAFT_447565 [Coniochaeta sp. 2T2.1]|nr:hypothetical protein GE09DRAFT_447565 [Coniochaeta sp. 2T2.1]